MKTLVTIADAGLREMFWEDQVLRKLKRVSEVDFVPLGARFTSEQLAERISEYDACITSWGSPFFTPEVLARAARLRAPVIEIHTGGWCDAVVDGHTARAQAEWQRIVTGAALARAAGLEVHAGHGLDYQTAETISALPEIAELNIGYFMMGEALFVGLGETVRQMRAAMDRGRQLAPGRP